MRVVQVPVGTDTGPTIGALVGGWIVDHVATRPDTVLGLANGSSPAPVYAHLVDAHRAGRVSFADVTGVLLDEYVGLPPGHARSYRSEIARSFLDHVDLPAHAVLVPDPHASDLDAGCERFEQAIDDLGGIDLQLLGIGADGHIGFNEPGSSLMSRTRVVELHPITRRDNARFFTDLDQVPRRAITQGIATILQARRLVVIATGVAKAEAVAAAITGSVTSEVPASALQRHQAVTWVVDDDAASLLSPRS